MGVDCYCMVREGTIVVAEIQTIAWLPEGAVRILDQTRLPGEEVYVECRDAEDVAEAIRRLRIRGAPATGVPRWLYIPPRPRRGCRHAGPHPAHRAQSLLGVGAHPDRGRKASGPRPAGREAAARRG